MNKSLTIPIAIVAGGVIIAVAVFVSMPKAEPSAGNPALVRPVNASDHILGNPAAQVVIVEYSDFDCDFCKGMNDTLHQVIANSGVKGSVAWVYRQFPLTELHPNALSHARASECAATVAGNDGFWKFAQALYNNQPADPANYGTIATSAGISTDAFATCVASASPDIDARINADRQNALDAGATGTPYSLIIVAGSAGWRTAAVMAGAYPYDAVEQLVSQALGVAR